MHKTMERNTGNNLLTNSEGLAGMCQSGLKTAREIGMNAGALVKIGRRTFWHVGKVQAYLDAIASGGKE